MINRREFIKAAGAATLISAAGWTARGEPPAPGPKIGVTPRQWGILFDDDPFQSPWSRFLDEARQAGYAAIELGPHGYWPADLDLLRRGLESRNLRAVAGTVCAHLEHEQLRPALLEKANVAAAALNKLGAKSIIFADDTHYGLFSGPPVTPEDLDDAGWECLVAAIAETAAMVRHDHGLRLAFAPALDTHVQTESQIDRLARDTDPDLVDLWLDVGHCALRGIDPIALLRRHSKRIAGLRLKDVDGRIRREAVEAESMQYKRAVSARVFCALGEGELDWTALKQALHETTFTGELMVDQEMYLAPLTQPMAIARKNREFLEKLLAV